MFWKYLLGLIVTIILMIIGMISAIKHRDKVSIIVSAISIVLLLIALVLYLLHCWINSCF